MAFNRATRCTGQIELTDGIIVNVDFEYKDSDNQAPNTANFNFNLNVQEGTSAWVNGSFDVINSKISSYNVSNGVVSDEIMNELIEKLTPIKTDYKTM